MKNHKIVLSLLALVLNVFSADQASAAIIIQPNETDSADTFAYQFFPANNFDNPGTSFGFHTALGIVQSNTGHTLRTLIRFDDLPVIPADDVVSAKLFLYSVSSPFGGSVSAINPITVDASLPAAAWDEATVTWNTLPAAGPLVTSTVFNAVNQFFSFDITETVKDWIGGSLANQGLLLSTTQTGSPSAGVAAPSSASANDEFWPYLEITVPEPASAMFVGAGVMLLALRRRGSSA